MCLMVGPEAPPQIFLLFHATALLLSCKYPCEYLALRMVIELAFCLKAGAQGNFSFGSYLACVTWRISRLPGVGLLQSG